MNEGLSVSVRLRGKGDGKKRSEDVIIEAIQKISGTSAVIADFARHPVLRAVSPETLLGKVSRKRASRLIESGMLSEEFEITVDAIFPRSRELDVTLPLSILLAELDLLPPRPTQGAEPLPILYEDEFFLAVDKPAGLPSAPLRSDGEDSAVQRVLASYPSLPILREKPLEPGLVHRLDTGTSGVLLFAKSEEAFARVDRAWNTGGVRKIYRALAGTSAMASEESPTSKINISSINNGLKMGRIELSLGHDLKSKKRMRAVTNAEGLKRIRGEPSKAVSEILTVRALQNHGGMDDLQVSDVEIRIETGVHHQIRATLSHLGAPIVGDSTYGGAPSERVWLHAWKLLLPILVQGEAGRKSLEIVAPLPSQWPKP